LSADQGITTAGTVSQQLSGKSLPNDISILVGGEESQYGIAFVGNAGPLDDVYLNFHIWITPDTFPNQNGFLDLSVNMWDIHVDPPTSWFESANDVLNKIKSGIAAAGTSINEAVLTKMATLLRTDDGMGAEMVTKFLENVSITFIGVGYPINSVFESSLPPYMADLTSANGGKLARNFRIREIFYPVRDCKVSLPNQFNFHPPPPL
jgi:hypothetical protein